MQTKSNDSSRTCKKEVILKWKLLPVVMDVHNAKKIEELTKEVDLIIDATDKLRYALLLINDISQKEKIYLGYTVDEGEAEGGITARLLPSSTQTPQPPRLPLSQSLNFFNCLPHSRADSPHPYDFTSHTLILYSVYPSLPSLLPPPPDIYSMQPRPTSLGPLPPLNRTCPTHFFVRLSTPPPPLVAPSPRNTFLIILPNVTNLVLLIQLCQEKHNVFACLMDLLRGGATCGYSRNHSAKMYRNGLLRINLQRR